MTFVPYPLSTVGRGAGPTFSTSGTVPTFTTSRPAGPTFTTYGHPGTTVDHVLAAESGASLLAETGDLITV